MKQNAISSVAELLDEFCTPEALSAQIQCDGCQKKMPSTRKIDICDTPAIVVIHLKRFQGLRKIDTPVYLDKDLTIDNKPYMLYAVCNHSGGINGGHYTAACRKRDGTWIMCNDNFITDINSLPIQSPVPYLLFYRINDKKN